MAQYELRDTVGTGTGVVRPATDFQTKGPKLGADGRPLATVEVLMATTRYGDIVSEVVEVEVPMDAGEIPTIPPLSPVTLVRPSVDVWAPKTVPGSLRARWSAEAVRVDGQKAPLAAAASGEKR